MLATTLRSEISQVEDRLDIMQRNFGELHDTVEKLT